MATPTQGALGATRTAAGGRGLDQEDDSGEWKEAGRQRARKVQGAGAAARALPTITGVAAGVQGLSTTQPPIRGGGGQPRKAARGGKQIATGRGEEVANGRAVFGQLKQYLKKGAPAEYVMQTVLKLSEMAKERRFLQYMNLLPAIQKKDREPSQLRTEWKDAIPYRLRTRHEGLASEWAIQDATHQAKLALLVHRWVITDKLSQMEVEERMRFFKFERGEPNSNNLNPREGGNGTFLTAVTTNSTNDTGSTASETERLRALCLRPVTATTQLRKRTADEKKALVMILNHEIEVPTVPPFLRLSMTPGELAVFEDMFMALEYSLYAHLEPGQRCYDTWTPTAVMELVTGGTEAAAAHVLKIEEFKSDLSRISVETTSRVVKVSFKGRAKAVKWVGWQMPLASRMLPLIDYEMIRNRSKRTHELVLMDYYSFEVEARVGELTSRAMYDLLTKDLGLQVQELEHTASITTGIIEKQWQVRVRSVGCPTVIRGKSGVVKGDTVVVLHHAAVHVNWPCRKCWSLEHPTRYCTANDDTIEVARTAATCHLEREEKKERPHKDTGRGRDAHARSLAKMEALLRSEGLGTTSEDQRATAQAPAPKREEGASLETRLELLHGGVEATGSTTEGDEPMCSLGEMKEPGIARTLGDPGQEAPREASGETAALLAEVTMQRASVAVAGGQTPSNEGDDTVGEEIWFAGDQENSVGGEDLDMTDMEAQSTLPAQFADAVKAVKITQREEATKANTKTRGRSPQRRVKGRGRTRSPVRNSLGPRSLNFAKEMDSREAIKREAVEQQETGGEDAAEGDHAERRVSLSPKRRVDRTWPTGRTHEEGRAGGGVLPSKTRSLSPKRRSQGPDRQGGKITMQKFMHEFMTAITGTTEADLQRVGAEMQEGNSRSQASSAESAGNVLDVVPHRLSPQRDCETVAEDPGFEVTKVTSPTDTGAPMPEWLTVLGGREVAVAANGHCGWLAFYSALYNKEDGLAGPSAEVVASANLLKKRVLNEMLAGLADEAQLHPKDLRAEASACGYPEEVAAADVDNTRVVANHLAEQRAKSVRATVTQRYWVRPMHLKAMACHARETIYVLDVHDNETARLQAYAYHEVKDAAGEMIETGTVCPVPTGHAMALLKDLIAAGIRPPVMILRWGPAGNHFQAVNYDHEAHQAYAQHIAVLAVVRNRILAEHGWKPMDSIEYDPAMTAKAAAAALTRMRKQPRATQAAPRSQGPRDGQTPEDSDLLRTGVSGVDGRALEAAGHAEAETPYGARALEQQKNTEGRERLACVETVERNSVPSGGGQMPIHSKEASHTTELTSQPEAASGEKAGETEQPGGAERR